MASAKVRNMRNEYRHSFLINLLVLIGVLLLGDMFLHETGPIGYRIMFLLYVVDGGVTLLFMYWLEKYSVTISGLYEQTLITVLSCIFTFVIMTFINLFFFTSYIKFWADICIMVEKIICVFITDLILIKVRNNTKWYRKPNLLILCDSERNIQRMKRIKYGVLVNYNSWYEVIKDMTSEEVKTFAEENLAKYDAICVLDGIDESDYSVIVSKAVELNKDLFIVPKMIDVGKTNARIVRFDDILTLYMPEKYLSKIEMFIKRLVDIVFATIGILLAIIPMAIIAVIIKLTSPGPVFYKQVRLTKGKKEFEIYKFRTMIPDAEKVSGPKFAEKDDPRITPIGKILRACRLDELPQIINILKGDMSLVGPRPERPMFVEQFESEIENYNYRFEVKAGLTSLSHVYGRYSTYIHDRTYYDLFYITHYSLMLDFKIILLTAKTMFLKNAAEGVNNNFNANNVQEVGIGEKE